MEKVIAAFDARRQFGRLLNDVIAKGDRFVVERHGEPVAAVVPMEVYEQWKQQRDAFFENMRRIAERVNLSEEEAMERADGAVQAVRHAQRA
jgi:prevent-host-death family protein